MPNRMVREGILDSEAVNALSLRGEVFYRRLMSIVDDFGRFEARPQVLRGKLFSCQLDRWTEKYIADALEECTRAVMASGEPLVTVYTVSGKTYLQINNFCQRTRAQKSKCPAPDQQLTGTAGRAPSNGGGVPTDAGQMPARSGDRHLSADDGHCLSNDGHLSALARLDGDGDGDGDGDEIPPKPPAAKNAAEHIEDEDPFRVAAETFDLSDEERQEAWSEANGKGSGVMNGTPPKKSLFSPEVETVLDQVARRIHARHPAVRRCRLAEVKKQLSGIARRVTAAKRVDLLHQVDQNHAAWCALPDWRKDGGQYAKGLENWLAPTKERWSEPPPIASNGGADRDENGYPRLMM